MVAGTLCDAKAAPLPLSVVKLKSPETARFPAASLGVSLERGGGPAYATTVGGDGPLGYWRFEEKAGTVAKLNVEAGQSVGSGDVVAVIE